MKTDHSEASEHCVSGKMCLIFLFFQCIFFNALSTIKIKFHSTYFDLVCRQESRHMYSIYLKTLTNKAKTSHMIAIEVA